ncbi:Methyltransferase [Candidatus Desulfarcum epimagneticum]|uniref:Methyltransferase n=1 Tax=uncultured Desulfobacteraceae bacterium TaxID=218296 RepID=A0A484HJR2_9BACT|nr:Methyltransferase [uncultured Desulfobacteraceae bacterium]
MENYLTISQAAKKIGVSSATLRRWDKSGKFPSQRHPINNYRVYNEDRIELVIKELRQRYITDYADSLRIQAKPVFETGLGKLFNEDAATFFKTIETSSVQLVFADPPYNIKKAEWDTFDSQKQYVDWSMEWIEEAHRALTPDGSLYICGFSEILADLKWAASRLFKGCKWLVWYYRNKANLSNDWGRSHESLLHFRKGKKNIFNVDEVRVPYNAHTLKYPRHPQAKTSQYGNGRSYVWTPHPKGAKPKDVLEIPTLTNNSWEREKHPTQKPIELVRKCVLASSNPDGLIVDPFGGSGTTYAVAEAFNRKWLGTEINLEYCEIIKKRLQNREHIQRIADTGEETETAQRRRRLRG